MTKFLFRRSEPGDTTWTQDDGQSAVRVWCNGMGSTSGSRGGRSTGIIPLAPGEQLHLHPCTDAITVDGVKVAGSADIRRGGNTLADRVIVAGGAAPDSTDAHDALLSGGDGGGETSGAGNGSFGGAAATQTSGWALGVGQPLGDRSGGAGWWGGFAGGMFSTGSGGSGFVADSLYEGSTVTGGAQAETGVLPDGDTATATVTEGSIVVEPIEAVAPNAPSLTAAGSVAFDLPNRFRHTFSSDQAWDRQVDAQMRVRLDDTATWTELDPTGSANQWIDVPAGTLSAGTWERQVRTKAYYGSWGPWSSSDIFTAAAAPAGLTIGSHIDGETIVLPVDRFTAVSTDGADSYEWQVLGDDPANPGSPDESNVIYDTATDAGFVANMGDLGADLPFATNNITVHVRVRETVDGVVGGWVTQTHPVLYTQPPAPSGSFMPDPDLGRALLTITNPASGEGEPATAWVEVRVDDGLGKGLERKARNGARLGDANAEQVPPNSTWIYWTPVAQKNYLDGASIELTAVGENGSRTTVMLGGSV